MNDSFIFLTKSIHLHFIMIYALFYSFIDPCSYTTSTHKSSTPSVPHPLSSHCQHQQGSTDAVHRVASEPRPFLQALEAYADRVPDSWVRKDAEGECQDRSLAVSKVYGVPFSEDIRPRIFEYPVREHEGA